ncbi:MAG: hypothetical protein ABH854_02410 [Candidatus Diapherotrites archaeon]
METFNFLIAILMMMIALQYQQNWIVIAVVALMAFTEKSVKTALVLIIAAIVMYYVMGPDGISSMWPVAVFGLIALSLIAGIGAKEKPEMYGGGGYGGLLGGM